MIRCFGWPGKVSLFCAIGLSCCNTNAQCKLPPELDAKLRVHPSTDVAIDAGNWFGSHQQFDCAVQSFRAALKTDPNSAQLYYLEGLALANSQHPDEAVEAVRQSTQLDSKVIKPHLLLASLYEQAGRHDDADKQWKLALAIDPRSELALESFSTALLVRKDYIGVIGLLQHAPRTEPLAMALSKAFGILNYYEEANEVLTEALKLSPRSLLLAEGKSVALIKMRKHEEAIKLLQQTVEQHPGNMEAEISLCRVLILTNHINLAKPLAPKLLAQNPHDAEILYLNGFIEHDAGNDAQAKAHLEEAVKLDPGFFSYRYKLGMVLVALREWEEAKQQLEQALALGATEPEVHFQLAMALRGLGEKDRALQEIQQYQDLKKINEDKGEAGLRATQADAELADGKVQDAIAHYREACDMEPEDGGFKYRLSIALHQAGDLEGERAQLEAAVKLEPKLAGAQKQLGYLLSRSGDAAGAVEHFKMAVEAQPAWTEAWVNLAAELAMQGNFPDSRKAAAMALRLDPANAQARELSDQLDHDPAAQQAQP
jgi:tetratricopeptide (TPR) repeat protein